MVGGRLDGTIKVDVEVEGQLRRTSRRTIKPSDGVVLDCPLVE